MCGIYAWQMVEGEKLTTFEATTMANVLAQEMKKRGSDSFGGAVWGDKYGDPEVVIRETGPVTEHGVRLFRSIVEPEACTQLLAHTRAATVGAVTAQNCHPFEIGDVLGVHNGGVYNHVYMNHKYKRDFNVDSQHIFGHINDGLNLEELDVYGAIVYGRFSEAFHTLYMGRSKQGSLEVGRIYRKRKHDKDGQKHFMVVIASTTTAIREACERLEFDYTPVHLSHELLYTVVGGEVYEPSGPLPLISKPAVQPVSRNRGGYSSDYPKIGGHCGAWFTNADDAATETGDDSDPEELLAAYRLANAEHNLDAKKKGTPQREGLHYADPFPGNIAAVRFMKRTNGVGKKVEVICSSSGCSDSCWLSLHHWGGCLNPTCSKPSDELCKIMAPICKDCGCYMVPEIHIERNVKLRLVWCTACQSFCVPAGASFVKRVHEILTGESGKELSKSQRKALRRKYVMMLRDTMADDDASTKDEKKAPEWDGTPRCDSSALVKTDGAKKINEVRCSACNVVTVAGYGLSKATCSACVKDASRKAEVWSDKVGNLKYIRPKNVDPDKPPDDCPKCGKYQLLMTESIKANKCGTCRTEEEEAARKADEAATAQLGGKVYVSGWCTGCGKHIFVKKEVQRYKHVCHTCHEKSGGEGLVGAALHDVVTTGDAQFPETDKGQA